MSKEIYLFGQVLLGLLAAGAAPLYVRADDASGQEVTLERRKPPPAPRQGQTLLDEEGMPLTGVPHDGPALNAPPKVGPPRTLRVPEEKPRGEKKRRRRARPQPAESIGP
jgi:hypothetical protein